MLEWAAPGIVLAIVIAYLLLAMWWTKRAADWIVKIAPGPKRDWRVLVAIVSVFIFCGAPLVFILVVAKLITVFAT